MGDNNDSGDDEKTKVVDNAWGMDIPKFKPEDNPHGMLEESSFATLFPKYRYQVIWISRPIF